MNGLGQGTIVSISRFERPTDRGRIADRQVPGTVRTVLDRLRNWLSEVDRFDEASQAQFLQAGVTLALVEQTAPNPLEHRMGPGAVRVTVRDASKAVADSIWATRPTCGSAERRAFAA